VTGITVASRPSIDATLEDFHVRYGYANDVEVDYIGRKKYPDGEGYVRFEGTERWICGWRSPNRSDAEPISILAAEVKHADFPFSLSNEKTDFIECMRSRSQTLEDAEVPESYRKVWSDLRERIDADIERYRKGDAAIELADVSGKAVTNAVSNIRQKGE